MPNYESVKDYINYSDCNNCILQENENKSMGLVKITLEQLIDCQKSFKVILSHVDKLKFLNTDNSLIGSILTCIELECKKHLPKEEK